MRVLVSGFEPFLNEKVNPTEQIVRFVNSCDGHGRIGWESLEVRGVLLPVLFDKAFRRLEQERQMFRPDIVLSFGLAGGRKSIDLEQTAANIRGRNTGAVPENVAGGNGHPLKATVRSADNAGVIGSGAIIDSAPPSLPTTLPTDLLMRALIDAGVPARLSTDAGTYVCNDLFFQMQHHLQATEVRSGFIHVPRLAEAEESETAWPWWKLEIALTTILTTLANEKS